MSHYSLRLTFEDWGAIRSALKAAGREDIIARMDDIPQCRLCDKKQEWLDNLVLENSYMARQVSRLSKRVSAQRRRIARFHEERDMAKIAAEYDLDPIGDMAADLRKTTPST